MVHNHIRAIQNLKRKLKKGQRHCWVWVYITPRGSQFFGPFHFVMCCSNVVVPVGSAMDHPLPTLVDITVDSSARHSCWWSHQLLKFSLFTLRQSFLLLLSLRGDIFTAPLTFFTNFRRCVFFSFHTFFLRFFSW